MLPTTTPNSEVRDILKGYFNAWTSGDIDTARHFLADRLDFQGSIDSFDNADDFVAALRTFHRTQKSACLLKEFYAPRGAMLLYDRVTDTPAGTVRTAECFAVSGRKIVEIRLVFDATKLRVIMGR